ncbi:MAG: glycosyl transferase, partial [Lactococcus lactis]
MISFVQTGNGIVDFILTLIFLVLITYPILGGFACFIGVLCYSFLF